MMKEKRPPSPRDELEDSVHELVNLGLDWLRKTLTARISLLKGRRSRLRAEMEDLRLTKERASRKGPRRGRMRKLNQWLDNKLADDARLTNEQLLRALPTDGELYRKGTGKTALIIESGRAIGRDGFDQRVTAARKRAKAIRR